MRAKRVLTRPRGWALLVAVVLVAGVPLFGSTLSGAQVALPTLTVTKVVTGAVPPGTTFTVRVECTGIAPAAAGGNATTPSSVKAQAPVQTSTITFNAQGDPTPPASNVVTPPNVPSDCTVTETATGGAQSVSYTCAVGSGNIDTNCTNSQSIHLGADSSGNNTITVTNAFPPPPPPPVVVSPRFTG